MNGIVSLQTLVLRQLRELHDARQAQRSLAPRRPVCDMWKAFLTRLKGLRSHPVEAAPLVRHIELPRRKVIRISVSAGDVIVCARGRLWIVYESSRKPVDTILHWSERDECRESAVAIVEALEDSNVEVLKRSADSSAGKPRTTT